ncbi:unnamed protein product [Amoebophrya sp. A120]|nr:unnamed protein product [Amoebophrya sp. A120]|eukprot:GSA120T00004749001.1
MEGFIPKRPVCGTSGPSTGTAQSRKRAVVLLSCAATFPTHAPAHGETSYPFSRACPLGHTPSTSSTCYDGTTCSDGEACCDQAHGGHNVCPATNPHLCPTSPQEERGLAQYCTQAASCHTMAPSGGTSETTTAALCSKGCTVVHLKLDPGGVSDWSKSSSLGPLIFRSGPTAYSRLPASCYTPAATQHCALRVCDARFLEVVPENAGVDGPEHTFSAEVRNLTNDLVYQGDVLQKQLSFTGHDVWIDEGSGCCKDPLAAHAFAGQRGTTLAQCKQFCISSNCDFLEYASTLQNAPASVHKGDTSSVCRVMRGSCRAADPMLGRCAEDAVGTAASASIFRTYAFQPKSKEVRVGVSCGDDANLPQQESGAATNWATSLWTAPTCGDTEVCREGRCHRTCVSSRECAAYPYRVCDFWDAERVCRHKELFADPVDMDLLGTFLFFLGSGLALSAGVGGGGIYVPLLILLLRFRAHKATAVSQSMLAGGAISVLLYNLKQRHPTDKSRSMVDFDLTAILGFPLMAGVQMGAVVHKISPDWLILFLLIAVLTDSGRRTLRKGLSLWRDENQARARPGLQKTESGSTSNPNVIYQISQKLSSVGSTPTSYQEFQDADVPEVIGNADGDHGEIDDHGNNPKTLARKNSPGEETGLTTSPLSSAHSSSLSLVPTNGSNMEQVVIAKNHSPIKGVDHNLSPVASGTLRIQPPSAGKGNTVDSAQPSPVNELSSTIARSSRGKVSDAGIQKMLLGVWMIMLVVSGVKTSLGYCTALFWLILLSATSVLLYLAYRHAQSLVKQYEERKTVSVTPGGNGQQVEAKSYRDTWEFFDTRENALRLLFYAYGAGVIAAMCGIGGGMLLGPIMMEMGLRPQVTTATTATTLFMLSTTASTIFIIGGQAPLAYSLFFAVVCCCGAILGKSVINYYVKKYNRTSVIALLLAGVILVSTVMLLIIGLLDLFGDVSAASRGSSAAKADLWFKGLCDETH